MLGLNSGDNLRSSEKTLEPIMPRFKLALTTGDSDGIGLEVTLKALKALGPALNGCYFVFLDQAFVDEALTALGDFRCETLAVTDKSSFFAACQKDINSIDLVLLSSTALPPIWVEMAAEACHLKLLNGLVTAPLSKLLIHQSGLNDMGHTQILKRVTKSASVHMGFLGQHFNLVLATDHIPIDQVSASINEESLVSALMAAFHLRSQLLHNKNSLPIALLGLNPHAGEAGLIGRAELEIHSRVVEKLQKKNIPVVGPIVPDAAFLPQNWSQYSVFVANYHDQGLIPFKMAHGFDDGVHVSLGLPFIRTSVDHGTAKELYGKDQANFGSMKQAIRWAVELTSN
jgi:4-hydroxythreonine-4-phosphate dehydrogenase